MVDVISVVLGMIQKIGQIADEMEEVGTQAARLARRLADLDGPVKRMKKSVEEGKDVFPERNVRQLENLVNEGYAFLQELEARKNPFKKVMNVRSDLERFQRLTEQTKEVVRIFTFNLSLLTWEQENERDRINDKRRLLHIEEMLEEQLEGFEQANENMAAQEDMHEEEKHMHTEEKKMHEERRKMHEEFMSHARQQRGVSRQTTGPPQKSRDWTEIDRSDIELGNKVIGGGSSGVVYVARWHGARVAVKVILDHDGMVDHEIRKLLKEIRIYQSLQHEFITQLYGASTSLSHVWLVMEYAKRGSLYEFLSRSAEPLKPELQLAFLSDIAHGMCFLHSRGILHCDLKSDNVLMCDNGRLKLCDFGMAKIMTQKSSSISSRRGGTTGWQAPEIIDEKPPTEKTDLYSFGMVCYEVATLKRPFAETKWYKIMNLVIDSVRPEIPASCHLGIVSLMQRCWAHNPDNRPASFQNVVKELDRMLEEAGGDPREGQEPDPRLPKSHPSQGHHLAEDERASGSHHDALEPGSIFQEMQDRIDQPNEWLLDPHPKDTTASDLEELKIAVETMKAMQKHGQDSMFEIYKAIVAEKVDVPRCGCILTSWEFDMVQGLSDREMSPLVWLGRFAKESVSKARKVFLVGDARLFLVCAHTCRLVPCGDMGQGYRIRDSLREETTLSTVTIFDNGDERMQMKGQEGKAYEALRDFVHTAEEEARINMQKARRRAKTSVSARSVPSFVFFDEKMEQVVTMDGDPIVQWVLRGEADDAWRTAGIRPSGK